MLVTTIPEPSQGTIGYSRISQVRGSLVKYLSKAKTLKPRFSCQESAKLQLKVDLLFKQWTDMFEKLVNSQQQSSSGGGATSSCLDQWCLEAQVYVSSCPVDGSDWDALYKVLSTVEGNKKIMPQLLSSVTSNSRTENK